MRPRANLCSNVLDDAGYTERRAPGGGHRHKGNVEIYCWRAPVAPREKKARPLQSTVPFEIRLFARFFGLEFPDNFVPSPDYIAAAKEVRARYDERTIVARGDAKRELIVISGAPVSTARSKCTSAC
jgi:hypothetical protein